MRIAYLSIGGHIHTERWLRYFVGRGHEVHLITVDPAPIEGVAVHDLRTGIPWKPLHYGVGILKLRRILRSIRPDLLHTHFLQGYGYWSVFAGVKPSALTVWGDDVYEAPHRSKLRMLLSQRAIKMADIITGDSQDILNELEKLGADPKNLHLILWGVELDRFAPGDGSAFRERWDIPPAAPVILSMRSFSRPYYNIDTIVDSLPAVIDRAPDAITVFAAYDGSGDELTARARKLGIEHSIRVVGRIDHEELPQALNAADVFVTVPSLDATAVSLLEAMATGRAIVASELPSNREWISDGVTGRIVPPRDAGALASAIADLIAAPDLRRDFGERCRAIACERAGYGENMRRMETLCEELVRRGTGSF